jgi:acyl dehydratase
MTYDFEAQKIDPRQKDGLYFGPSSGHLNPSKAEKIGMGGTYGYGASMNAWHLDSVAFWAGLEGYVWHSKTQFRKPAFEGDVTFIDGTVTDKREVSAFGVPTVTIETVMTTQDGDTILTGSAEVSLPFSR